MANVLKHVNTHRLQIHHILFRALSNTHTNNYYRGAILMQYIATYYGNSAYHITCS
jgi:hypothetical protein